jgi:hypothetical protein
MTKAAQLQAKAAKLPEPIAAEVLDFLDFVISRKEPNKRHTAETIKQVRGLFKGRLSSTAEFAANKADEIRLEKCTS